MTKIGGILLLITYPNAFLQLQINVGNVTLLIHIWWNCSKMKQFWKIIQIQIITKNVNYLVPFAPWLFLLYGFS